MLFISYGYKELNNADPDCGTTFTWGVRAFGPKTGWLGGWAIVAADVLVMASLAQVAGQYVFLLFNANGIGSNANSGWVLLVGILWIVVMTAICYVGIEVSANFQKALLGIELTMLLVLSIVALIKVGNGSAPLGHLTPALGWFNPFHSLLPPPSSTVPFDVVHLLGLGHDCLGQRGNGRFDQDPGPGRRALDRHFVGDLRLVILAAQSYAGIGTKGIGSGQSRQPERRTLRARALGLRHVRLRKRPLPPPAPHGAQFGGGVDADHHPADSPYHLGHGCLQGDTFLVLQGQQAFPHPHRLDGCDGRRFHRALRDHELHLRRGR